MFKIRYAIAALALLGSASHASGASLFSETFEGFNVGDNPLTSANWDINTWGIVVGNPDGDAVNSSSNIVNFSQTRSGGDLFSKIVNLTAGRTYQISFDFYGDGSSAGGFAGLSADSTPYRLWYYSTDPGASDSNPILASDNDWHHYDYVFVAPVFIPEPPYTPGIGSSVTDIRLMFQDYSNGAGNAYFDNISLTSVPVPVPAALPLFGTGLAALGLISYRRRRRSVSA